jgi:hypothetical protein
VDWLMLTFLRDGLSCLLTDIYFFFIDSISKMKEKTTRRSKIVPFEKKNKSEREKTDWILIALP